MAGLTGLVTGAQAQTASGSSDGWDVTVYPVLAWVPLGILIDVDVPPPPGGGGDGGSASIVDSRFDGAFLGGVSVSNRKFRFDSDVIWAGVGGDRIERPRLVVDADIIYAHGSAGWAIARDFYVTGGVRRLALKYNVTLGDLPEFSRKPGVWDPLVGVGWHKVGPTMELHATFEGGGFGVGADADVSSTVRFDWKPVKHFGLTAGYNVFYFKVTDNRGGQEFRVEQTLHGPLAGIGLYF